MEEETEKGGTEEPGSEDDHYCFFSHKTHTSAFLSGEGYLLMSDVNFFTSYSHKPETPPPDFC
jgi:hypothetical protein